MREVHSFNIPDFEYLTDAEGLLETLMSKVIDGKCLFCKADSSFSTPHGAQQHMVSKSHCKLRYETDADFDELGEYFEYSSGEEDDGDDEERAAGRMIIPTAGGAAIVADGDDLILPSGRRVAHRRWMRYYTQYYRLPDEKLTKQLERLALDYDASGVVSMTSLAVARRTAELSHGVRGNVAVPADQKRQQQYQRRFELQTGMQTNMLIRKYFRIQLLQ